MAMMKHDKIVNNAPQLPRRYSIQSDGDHKYFVEVGMEGEFEAWVAAGVCRRGSWLRGLRLREEPHRRHFYVRRPKE